MAEQYISGEEHQMMRGTGRGPRRKSEIPASYIVIAIAAVVLCGLSFLGGVSYQKHHAGNAAGAAAGRGFTGGGFARRQGGFGQVTTVSASSITIQNQRSGSDSTYSITSGTTITDNGQTVSVSDIKSGDTVAITTGSSGSTTATRILVNPSFGGGAAQSDQGSVQSN